MKSSQKKFGVILIETRECRMIGSIYTFAKENIEGKGKILPLVKKMGLPSIGIFPCPGYFQLNIFRLKGFLCKEVCPLAAASVP